VKFPFLTDDEIELAAKRLLTDAFGGPDEASTPVDLDVIVYDHLYDNEGVAFRDDLDLGSRDGDRILGRTEPLRRALYVDAQLKREGPEGRFRFTVAHEVGHWILHSQLYAQDEAQGSLFRELGGRDDSLVSLQRNVFPAAGQGRLPPEEWQANRFAIALLLDSERLRAEFRSRIGVPYATPSDVGSTGSVERCRQLARSIAVRSVDGAPPLTDVFGLSAEAMAIALERRGYVRRTPTAL